MLEFQQTLLEFVKEQREFNVQVISRLDNVDKILNKVEKRLDGHSAIFEHNNLK